MLKNFAYAAAAVVALAVTPAYAQDKKEVDGWEVFQNADNCTAITTYKNNISLAVSFAPARNSVGVFVNDPSFKPLVDGEEYPLNLYFLTGEKLNSNWGTVKTRGVVSDSLTGFYSSYDSTAFLDDFSGADFIAFFRGGDVVVSLDIKGNQNLVTELRSCGARLSQG